MNAYVVISFIIAGFCILIDVWNIRFLIVRTAMPQEKKFTFLSLELLHLAIFGFLFALCPFFVAAAQKILGMGFFIEAICYIVSMTVIGYFALKAGNRLELKISEINSKYI